MRDRSNGLMLTLCSLCSLFRDARGFFPRALELMGSTDSRSPSRAKFLHDTELVPCWMFIQWIPQLLAVINLPQGPLAFPILMRIAKEYPQAMFYPFSMTRVSSMRAIAQRERLLYDAHSPLY